MNSSCLRQWKNRILSELQNDEHFLEVLGTTEEEREDLVYYRLFPHYYIPDTIDKVTTYVCVEIDIRTHTWSKLYAYPTITFTILAHQDDMKLNMAGISATRIDYLSELIDTKYNGALDFGVGKLELETNIAGNLNTKYRYRQLVFKGVDINDNLCDRNN